MLLLVHQKSFRKFRGRKERERVEGREEGSMFSSNPPRLISSVSASKTLLQS